MASFHDIWKKFRKWCRLIILLHKGGESVCKDLQSQMSIEDITEIYNIEILDTKKSYPLITKMRQKRNELFRLAEGEIEMTEQLFNDHWNSISKMLTSLNYNMDLIKDLKTGDCLSQEHEETLKDITQKMKGSTK